jgi:recombination protein RecA
MAEKAEKSVFDSLKDRINKNVKGTHVAVMSESDIAKPSEWVRTPALDLNRILSGSLYRGIPNRHLIGIVGPEHTFKSSFMVLCMADAQKQGYKPVIIDTEGGAGEEFCRRWGLDTENTLYIYSPWVDEVRSTLAQIKEEGAKKLIIGIDSIGGLDRYKAFEDALKGDPKADQGLLQKNIRSMLKLLLNICIEQETIGIVTGHMYSRPGLIPMPDQVGGGKAMRMFPTILINLKRELIKDDDKNITGTDITASTLKNRLYPPFQESVISIDYHKGIDPYAGLLDLLMTAGLVTKDGNTYSAGDVTVGVGYGAAQAKLCMLPALIEKLDEWLKTTGYSTVNNNLKQAEEMLEKEEIPEEAEVEEEKENGTRKGKRQLTKK